MYCLKRPTGFLASGQVFIVFQITCANKAFEELLTSATSTTAPSLLTTSTFLPSHFSSYSFSISYLLASTSELTINVNMHLSFSLLPMIASLSLLIAAGPLPLQGTSTAIKRSGSPGVFSDIHGWFHNNFGNPTKQDGYSSDP